SNRKKRQAAQKHECSSSRWPATATVPGPAQDRRVQEVRQRAASSGVGRSFPRAEEGQGRGTKSFVESDDEATATQVTTTPPTPPDRTLSTPRGPPLAASPPPPPSPERGARAAIRGRRYGAGKRGCSVRLRHRRPLARFPFRRGRPPLDPELSSEQRFETATSMGLFKTKKARGGAFPSSADDRGVPGTSKAGGVRSLPSLPSSPFGKRGKKKKLRSKLPGRGAYEESLEESPEEDRERKAPEAQRPEARRDEDSGGGGGGGGDRACVPRSISAPSREAGSPLPPLPVTPGRDGAKGGAAEEEEDSIGSPCEAVRRSRRRTPATKGGDDGADDGAGDGDDAPRAPNPTAAHLRRCARALAPEASPDTGADAPSRALRHLFALSEDGGDKGARRIAMVRDGGGDGDGGDGANGGEGEGEEGGAERASSSLVPSLLSFLRRCPRDSSEQYLALLVLNNLSIPRTNKRPVAYTHGGARTLGRLLCEDPGCHLLAIVLVNLTFGDAELNRDLVEDGEAQLVEGLAYAFRLASLSARRLASLGPVPLTDADGAPREPRDLLASLDASLAEGPSPNDDDEEGDDADDEGGPFPETARWCLGAIKNLTRPGRLASLQGEEGGEEAEEDGALQATRATLDAGVLPAMLDVLERKDGAGGGRGAFVKGWQPNSAPDAALYALMHMASAPRVRERMRREGRTRAEGGTTEATIMGRCERTLAEILERGREMDGSLSPKASKRKGKGKGAAKGEEDDKEAGQARLQCLKARMALAHLLPEPPRVESSVAAALSPVRLASLLAAHEAHSLVELLSHVLAGRAKEGPGGYSSAAFSPKGVLHVLDRVLSEGGNRELFAATGCARRLNALLLGALAKYALGRKGEGEGGGGGGGAGPGATEA
ncbi:hypothetical protein ACHAWF_009030, partial [Thalassiosira exigua]